MLLKDAVEPSIAQHGGRVVKNTDDGLLAEFRSAVEAALSLHAPNVAAPLTIRTIVNPP
jgi:class 3 adenylate cyclase